MIKIPSILIVEDNKDFRQAVCRFLELKYIKTRMLEASTRAEGLKLAYRLKPQIVIIDLFLEGANGLEMAEQIKKCNSKCHIIMLTLLDSKEIAHVVHNRSVSAFIGKKDLYCKLVPEIDKILNHEKTNHFSSHSFSRFRILR